MTSTTLC